MGGLIAKDNLFQTTFEWRGIPYNKRNTLIPYSLRIWKCNCLETMTEPNNNVSEGGASNQVKRNIGQKFS
jgi:hypothetical protein